MYGQTHTQETLDKMSACKVGEKHPRFGKNFPHSEATKEKIRETKRRNKEAKLLALQIENGVSEGNPDTP